jgi:ribosome biogenesis GTPase
MHLNEPNCAVKTALKEGKISNIRYDNYKTLYEELKEFRRY